MEEWRSEGGGGGGGVEEVEADRAKPIIAVVNSYEDTVEMLRLSLQQEWFASVITAHTFTISRPALVPIPGLAASIGG